MCDLQMCDSLSHLPALQSDYCQKLARQEHYKKQKEMLVATLLRQGARHLIIDTMTNAELDTLSVGGM